MSDYAESRLGMSLNDTVGIFGLKQQKIYFSFFFRLLFFSDLFR